jgi:hypothetical protein
MSKVNIAARDACNHTLTIDPNTSGPHHHRYFKCLDCGTNFFDGSQLSFKIQEHVKKRVSKQIKIGHLMYVPKAGE